MAEIESALRGRGHEIVPLKDKPELCIINTCSVTSKSDYESRQMIRRAKRVGAKVLVTGCYSELNKDSVRAMGVEDIISNLNKDNYINGLSVGSKSKGLSLLEKSRYILKIQDGCNSSCSYCIIPKARGRSRGMEPSKVIERVRLAEEAGYKEVVLSGIHLGQYGNLTKLIEGILRETNIPRIRLSSLEIGEVDDALLEVFKESRLCRHLHIPIQSGDDTILRAMNRRYNIEEFSKRIFNIVKRFPDIALGTDVIVGFPGEGEEEFENTYRVLESLPFSYFHVFPYSQRKGTPASKMGPEVGSREKSLRAKRLRDLSLSKKTRYQMSQIGRTLDIIIEERVGSGICRGTSSNYLKVQFPDSGMSIGNLILVRIEGLSDGVLFGVPVN